MSLFPKKVECSFNTNTETFASSVCGGALVRSKRTNGTTIAHEQFLDPLFDWTVKIGS